MTAAQKKALRALTEEWKTAVELQVPQASLFSLVTRSQAEARQQAGVFYFRKTQG